MKPAETCVIHVDIDAFFASVEELRNPSLTGLPVAVGSGVIASCNYPARRFGLSAGMPLREARKRCPDLVVLEGHYAIYRCFAEEVFRLCRQYAPAIESHLDEAFCDLSGTERLYGFRLGEGRFSLRSRPEPPAMVRELQERIRREVGLSASVGMGRNRMLAKMASKSSKPGGLRVIDPAGEDSFLRPLPVRLLPGVGPRTAELLGKLNIQSIEDLRVLSRESLRVMLGENGAFLYERCRGEDTRVVSAREIPRSVSRETSFHTDTTATGEIEGMLHYLTERAASTIRSLGLKAGRVEVKLRYADFQEETGGKSFRTPTQLDGEIFEAALALRRSLHNRRVALRLVGVTLLRLVPDSGLRPLDLTELKAFGGGGERPGGREAEEPPVGPSDTVGHGDLISQMLEANRKRQRSLSLCRSLDRIRERFGHSAVVSGKSLHLLGKLPQDAHGYVLRTPCLTR